MAIQTWRGCTETISLARLTLVDAPAQTVELAEQSLPQVVVPLSERAPQRQPGSAVEVNVARAEEPGVPALSLSDIHARDYEVGEVASNSRMPDLRPSQGTARELGDLASPAPIPEALRITLDTPTEIKYRIWIQPMDQPASHQLRRAPDVPCPAFRMLGLEAWTAPLETSSQALEAGLPDGEGFAIQGAVQGLVTREGNPLQGIVTVASAEAKHLLYPGSRRVCIPSPSPMNGTGE
jgi:hypothetical protein